MAIKHNNELPNGHFRKQWQRRVKTWLDQPARKQRRRLQRLKKAARLAPRPVEQLRPIVQCPRIKYNRRARLGRGFTKDECKHAGIDINYARRVGIAIDLRRRTHSVEALKRNSEILQDYMQRLVVFPKKSSKAAKKLIEAGKYPKLEDIEIAKDYGGIMPAMPAALEGYRKITDADRNTSVWNQLRQRKFEKYDTRRALFAKREAEKAEAMGSKKK